MEPLDPNEKYQDRLIDDYWDQCAKTFVPGVKKGFVDSCERMMAGHEGDRGQDEVAGQANHCGGLLSEAFFQAAQSAFQDVCEEEGIWQILEPVMSVEVNSPHEFSTGVQPQPFHRTGAHHQTGRDDWFSLEAEVP